MSRTHHPAWLLRVWPALRWKNRVTPETIRCDLIAGLTVAMITPFRNGQIDIETLQQQVEFQIGAGTTCLAPAGTTGESPTVNFDEHKELIRVAVEHAKGRIPIIAGTGGNSTAEAIELTLGSVLKYDEDQEVIRAAGLEQLVPDRG